MEYRALSNGPQIRLSCLCWHNIIYKFNELRLKLGKIEFRSMSIWVDQIEIMKKRVHREGPGWLFHSLAPATRNTRSPTKGDNSWWPMDDSNSWRRADYYVGISEEVTGKTATSRALKQLNISHQFELLHRRSSFTLTENQKNTGSINGKTWLTKLSTKSICITSFDSEIPVIIQVHSRD